MEHSAVALQPVTNIPPLTCGPLHTARLPGDGVRHPSAVRDLPGAIVPGGSVHTPGQQTVRFHPGNLHLVPDPSSRSAPVKVKAADVAGDGVSPLQSVCSASDTARQTLHSTTSRRRRNVFLGSGRCAPPSLLSSSVTLHRLTLTAQTPPTALHMAQSAARLRQDLDMFRRAEIK